MGEWRVFKYPSSNGKECPRISSLDNAIWDTQLCLNETFFFGKNRLRTRIAVLQNQRSSIVAECQSDLCPGVQQETAVNPSGYHYLLPRECGVQFITRATTELQQETERFLIENNTNENTGE